MTTRRASTTRLGVLLLQGSGELTRAEVRSVDGPVSVRFGGVDVLAARAVKLDGLLVGDVRETHGEEGLRIAVDAGASSKVGLLILLHLAKTVDCQRYVARGNQSRSARRTIFVRPREVAMYRAWIRPYRKRADASIDSRTPSSRSSSAVYGEGKDSVEARRVSQRGFFKPTVKRGLLKPRESASRRAAGPRAVEPQELQPNPIPFWALLSWVE